MSTGYVVEGTFKGLECGKLVEQRINHEATEYFAANYNSILAKAKRIPGVDPSKVEDLVQDVFTSLMASEEAGEGYDISHSWEGSVITVAEFVLGRLKLYSKNQRYHISGCDRKYKGKRKDEEKSDEVIFDIAFASPDGSDLEDMSAMQRAYATAHTYEDEIESIDESISIRQNIDFCLEFNEVVGFNFLNLFKNLKAFSANFDASIFDNLREKLRYHDELGEALHAVLEAAINQRRAFDYAMAAYN